MKVIDFSASSYLSSPLRGFLERGGEIDWRIVPTNEKKLEKAEPAHLVQQLRESLAVLVEEVFFTGLLVERSLITPSCGTGSLSKAGARKVYQLSREVSDHFKEKHIFHGLSVLCITAAMKARRTMPPPHRIDGSELQVVA